MKLGWVNYRLRTLFFLMAIVAVVLVAIPPFYDWYTNPPSVSLSSVVASFNESKVAEEIEKNMTTEEVVASIRTQLPNLVESERVKNILRRIVERQRVPSGTTIEYVSVRQASAGRSYSASHLFFKAGAGQVPVHILIRESRSEETSEHQDAAKRIEG